MKQQIFHMTFKKENQDIEMLCFSEPLSVLNYGLVGYLETSIFNAKIGILIDSRPEDERDYDLACLSCAGSNHPLIRMDENLFQDLLDGKSLAKVSLLHEVGHYVHGDLDNEDFNTPKYDAERKNALDEHRVIESELWADSFAASYLGVDTVVSGLKQIEEHIKAKYSDYEDCQISIDEIEDRIMVLQMQN